MTFIPVYPRRPPLRWLRIHTALVLAVIVNSALLVLLGWYAGAFAEDTIYEVNLVNVIKTDAEVKSADKPEKHLTLDPARARPKSSAPKGEAAPAPAPGHKPQNVTAKAPPKLKVDAPQIVPDNGPSEPDPSIVNNPPPPPDASLNGNPEGVPGGTGNQEGPGGTGTGGTGTGGRGSGGGGSGFPELVRDVRCLGCHQAEGGNRDVEPDQIEKLFAATQWRGGGTKHLLTLGVTLNDQGYVKDAVVLLSTGNAEVDTSAIMFLKLSKWKNHTGKEIFVEMPLEVYF